VRQPPPPELIDVLRKSSEQFAQLWADHPISDGTNRPVTKAFNCFGLGTVRVRATGFPVLATQHCRMVVYLPETRPTLR
jgi:hypothetical protein